MQQYNTQNFLGAVHLKHPQARANSGELYMTIAGLVSIVPLKAFGLVDQGYVARIESADRLKAVNIPMDEVSGIEHFPVLPNVSPNVRVL
jgi:hypothetical protein